MPFSESFNNDIQRNEVKVAVLEEKVGTILDVVSKLEETISKISDLSVNVSKMLAVHEEKLEYNRETVIETSRELLTLNTKVDMIRELHGKRFEKIEKKIWIGFGVLLTMMFVLQTPTITGMVSSPNNSSNVVK